MVAAVRLGLSLGGCLQWEHRRMKETREGEGIPWSASQDEVGEGIAMGVPRAKFVTVDVPFKVAYAYDGWFRVNVSNRKQGDADDPPLVILFGWLGSTIAELGMIAEVYESKGHSTVSVAFPPPLIMPWRLGTSPEVRHTLSMMLGSLADFLETEPLVRRWALEGERKYVFHAFSAGALAVLHVACPELYRGPKAAEAHKAKEAARNKAAIPSLTGEMSSSSLGRLRERTAGVIFDSCPVSDSLWEGLVGAYNVVCFVSKAYGSIFGTILYLCLLLYDAFCLLDPFKILFGRRPRWVAHWPQFSTFSFGYPIPELYLYDREDPFIDYTSYRVMLDARDEMRAASQARPVQRKCFLKSQHCKHVVLNSREYWGDVDAFMRKARFWWAVKSH